ncbi:MAG: MotA/TolQ/ExbB proton channel family protein [Candidatus Nealsonbacteria bacterium]|nr:MotA/TolQ/ExbB proton channel family protein [Candidatus Nealsonbacteria bacterium]
MSKPSLSQTIAKSPIFWGGLATVGFYWLIEIGLLSHWLVQRYCASHPVEYVTVAMFFVGLAALVLKMVDVLAQRPRVSQTLLGPPSRTGRPAEECDVLLRRLDGLPRHQKGDYLFGRLREAIEHVRRLGSAEKLDDHSKYLADVDAARMHSGYALVRVIIWAIPMLGFLGTVTGLTLAIANLNFQAMEASSLKVVGGLAVAFDTTALALALTLLLMFAQFLTEGMEGRLLDEVDRRATAELEGRFEYVSSSPDGQLVAVRRMAEAVIEATEQLVRQQADLWQHSMDAAGKRWTGMADAAGEQLQGALAAALGETLQTGAEQLATAATTAVAQNQQHWDRTQRTHAEQVQALGSLQESMHRQAEVLGRAVDAAGTVAGLEETLNRNLTTLAGAQHFEQTVTSLAATIHLLNGRLTEVPNGTPAIQLESNESTPRAA